MVKSAPDPDELAKTNRLSIDIEGIDLPTDDDTRQALLDNIEKKIDQIVEKEGLSANSAEARTGHQYAQVAPHCPRCDYPLDVRTPVTIEDELPPETHASVLCTQCGYGGGAVYELVDIEQNKYDPERRAETYRSEVADREIYPIYHSY